MNNTRVDGAWANDTGVDNVGIDSAGASNKIRDNDKSRMAKDIRVDIIIRKSKTHILVSF